VQTLTEAEVRQRLDPAALIDGLEFAFRERYPAVVIPTRTHIPIHGGMLLTMPCYDPSSDAFGMKIVAVKNGVHATYLLIDPLTGSPKLTIEANYLTDIRTAATSALATKFLARTGAKTLGIFGTGRQGRAHLTILPLVRDFERALICGRDEKGTWDFIASCGSTLRVQAASPNECAAESDVLCTCTTAVTPLFNGNLVRPGTHLNLVGAFQPHTREVDSLTIKRSRVLVDMYDGALSEAGDLLMPMNKGVIKREDLMGDLHELVTRKKPGRTSDHEITLFKSVGCALEDLVAAELLLSN
jgi:alanine dehydrogenase